MLVYGDAEAVEAPGAKIARIRALLAEAATCTGIARHGLLVAALIEAGELAQGLADHAFAQAGRVDVPSPGADAAMVLTLALARHVAASWDALSSLPCHARARPGHLDQKSEPVADDRIARTDNAVEAVRESDRGGRVKPGHDNDWIEVGAALDALCAHSDLPAEILIKQPEGFAHYAVYPEAYLEAGRALPSDTSQVLGIRSIGTTLAAMLAAARGLPAPATVRPVGHPFRRELSLRPDGAATIADDTGTFAIADEGPGFSGSSFASVALWLESRGVPLTRIHFVPSHGGEPGPQADPEVRHIWAAVPRQVRTFDDVVLVATDPAHRLESWVSDLVGEPEGDLVDISGGGWRRHRPGLAEVPVLGWQEKRKFLLETESGTWLLKFSGLGRVGLAKRERAQALAEAGFTPPVAGWRHGFLVERWIEDARPLWLDGSDLPSPLRGRWPERGRSSCGGPDGGGAGGTATPHPGRPPPPAPPRKGEESALGLAGPPAPNSNAGIERGVVLDHLGAYLGFRTRSFPAPGRGAPVEKLFEMARYNIAQGVGENAAGRLDRWRPTLDALERHRRPVETDNRLQLWEWLVTADGRILKMDALDHHAGHDLIGPQDVAWDVAGAAIEFELSPAERENLMAAIERAGGLGVEPELAAFCLPCYAAFWLGYYTMAAGGEGDPAEHARLTLAVDRYRAALDSLLTPL